MEMLTVRDAAKELGISREAVYLAIREGRLVAVQILGKYGIPRESLAKYQPEAMRIKAAKESSRRKPGKPRKR